MAVVAFRNSVGQWLRRDSDVSWNNGGAGADGSKKAQLDMLRQRQFGRGEPLSLQERHHLAELENMDRLRARRLLLFLRKCLGDTRNLGFLVLFVGGFTCGWCVRSGGGGGGGGEFACSALRSLVCCCFGSPNLPLSLSLSPRPR
jgi:hypothetical protein